MRRQAGTRVRLSGATGTCAIGAVVDERGRVYGYQNLGVADASIMPTIPRANTNLPTAAIAERLAETI